MFHLTHTKRSCFACLMIQSPRLIDFAIEHGKHVLVEKPLFLDPQEYADLSSRASEAAVTVYVAYNHRFEPHIAAAKRILDSGEIGEIYTVSLSYGNGTAALVRASPWRDTGLGVIADLGSHLLDMVDFGGVWLVVTLTTSMPEHWKISPMTRRSCACLGVLRPTLKQRCLVGETTSGATFVVAKEACTFQACANGAQPL